MKKILFILFAISMSLPMMAQKKGVSDDAKSAFSLTSDTVTNSETLYMTIPFAFQGNYSLAIQPYISKLTGTTAGTALLQAEVGNTWVTQNTDNNPDITAGNDTLTLVDGASTIWYIRTRATNYRVAFVSTGTHTSVIKCKFVYKEIYTEKDQ